MLEEMLCVFMRSLLCCPWAINSLTFKVMEFFIFWNSVFKGIIFFFGGCTSRSCHWIFFSLGKLSWLCSFVAPWMCQRSHWTTWKIFDSLLFYTLKKIWVKNCYSCFQNLASYLAKIRNQKYLLKWNEFVSRCPISRIQVKMERGSLSGQDGCLSFHRERLDLSHYFTLHM